MDLFLKIVSPSGKIFESKVKQVTLPGTQGPFTILKQHAPIVSSLNKGNIKYETSNGKKTLAITSGFIEMSDNKITACVTIV